MIAPSTATLATLELMDDKPIVGISTAAASSLVPSSFFPPDPFYLHSNKPFTFYLIPNDNINNYFWLFG